MGIRNLVRRLILWAAPEAAGYAEGGAVRESQRYLDDSVPGSGISDQAQEILDELNHRARIVRKGL